MRKKQIMLIAKTSDRVGCDLSDLGFCKRVATQIAVPPKVLGLMLVRWVKHGGW